MLQEIRSKLNLTSKASKRAKMDYSFVVGLADLLPYQAGRSVYAIEWAVKTGRLPGDVEMAIRKLSAWDFVTLVSEVVTAEISQNDTPRWLIRRFS